jgi:phosphoribosyl 1,2-cyclic phosphodiesterase
MIQVNPDKELSASDIKFSNSGTSISSTNVQGAINELDAIDISSSFSASSSALHISATKRGNRVTLIASGYGSSFGNGTTIYINDTSLIPNTSSGTYLGGGSGVSISTQQYVYTIGQYAYDGSTHRIAIFHSQNIAVDALHYNVIYEIA